MSGEIGGTSLLWSETPDAARRGLLCMKANGGFSGKASPALQSERGGASSRISDATTPRPGRVFLGWSTELCCAPWNRLQVRLAAGEGED